MNGTFTWTFGESLLNMPSSWGWDDDTCEACQGEYISYWTDGIYGSCLFVLLYRL
jgi:hypothetical protein